MRIVGAITNDHFKISIFQLNNSYSIKIEDGMVEQVYKFREGSFSTIESLKERFETHLLPSALDRMAEMRKALSSLQESGDDMLTVEEII